MGKPMGQHDTEMHSVAVARRAARLIPVFAIAFAAAMAGPVIAESGSLTISSALAGNHGGGNNGNKGGRKDEAPGQVSKIDESTTDGAGDADPVDAVTAESGSEPLPVDLLPIDPDAVPANIEVIKEIAGLPDESSLSEQEELEAIMSGWDTWRTADGPNSSAIQ